MKTTTKNNQILTEENWESLLPRLFKRNTIEKNACYEGFMFETYGKEREEVLAAFRENPAHIATLISCDDDGSIILAHGFHYVNRLGYFVAKKPLAPFPDIIVAEGDDISAEEADDATAPADFKAYPLETAKL